MPTSKRILLCRLGVVLFCVLPTLSVFGWALMQTTLGLGLASKSDWESELSTELGLAVEIETVAYAPGAIARLHLVRLFDPETRALIGQVHDIDITAAASGWIIKPSQLELEANQLAVVLRALQRHPLQKTIGSRSGGNPRLIRLLPCDVVIRREDQSETLREFHCQWSAADSGAELQGEFQIAERSATPIQFSLIRSKHSPQRELEWRCDTHAAALPCRLLVDVWPALRRLGNECTFAGQVRFAAGVALSGQLSGTFHQLDCDTLISEHFPHQLSGLATCHVDQLRIKQGKVIEIRGALEAQDGSLSSSLLAAAAEHLGLEAFPEAPSERPNTAIAFRRLAIGFHLDGENLKLAAVGPTQKGVLIANASGPLLTAPPDHRAPTLGLVRTLLPANEYQVPATRQTAALVSLLPLPDVARSPTATTAHTPTRLAPPTASPPSAIRQPVLR
jgi:hypothetical protein